MWWNQDNTTGRASGWRGGRELVALACLALLTACSSLGPKSISRDQFDYGNALIESAEEQLLANMVRMRYVEAPKFLNVASVINQYALEGQVSAGLGFGSSFTGGDTQSLGVAGKWADRPTITYSPVSGQEFSRYLLTPLPPTALFSLLQSGWPVDLVLRVTVQSINGIRNESPFPRLQKPADERFFPLLEAWNRILQEHVVGVKQVKHEEQTAIVVFFPPSGASPQLADDLAFVKEALGLEPSLQEYTLVYGLVPGNSSEIAVLTNSMLEILSNLGFYFDVPPEHVAEGRTGPTFTAEEHGAGPPLINVRVAEERPQDAMVAIENRGYWFYIDDRDMNSKRTFAFLQIMLSLAETGERAVGPVVAIGG